MMKNHTEEFWMRSVLKYIVSLFLLYWGCWSYSFAVEVPGDSSIVKLIDHSSLKKDSHTSSYKINIGVDTALQIGSQIQYYLPSTSYYANVGVGFAMGHLLRFHQFLSRRMSLSDIRDEFLLMTLRNSVVFSGAIGWIQHPQEGSYVELGYRMMVWGSGEIEGQWLNNLFRRNTASRLFPSHELFYINTLSHGPTLQIGYRFAVTEDISLDWDLGLYRAFAMVTRMDFGDYSLQKSDKDQIHRLIHPMWFVSMGIWLGVAL